MSSSFNPFMRPPPQQLQFHRCRSHNHGQNQGGYQGQQQHQMPVFPGVNGGQSMQPLGSGGGQFGNSYGNKPRASFLKVWRSTVLDYRQGEVPPLAEDIADDLEFLHLVHSGIVNLKNDLVKERLFPIFAKCSDSQPKNHERARQVSDRLDLSMDDKTWKGFIDGLDQLNREQKLSGRSYYKMSKDVPKQDQGSKPVATEDPDMKTMMQMMMALMQKSSQTTTNEGEPKHKQARPAAAVASAAGAGNAGNTPT